MKQFAVLFLLVFYSLQVFSAEKQAPQVAFDSKFYRSIRYTSVMARVDMLEQYLQKICTGKGRIEKLDKGDAYKRRHRLVLQDQDSLRYGLKLYYNIYFNTDQFVELVKNGEMFEFRGQFMSYTFFSLDRKSISIDVILEEGALLIQ